MEKQFVYKYVKENKQKVNKKNISAYTLAEALTALLIIGVVSALIIPMTNYSYRINVAQTVFTDTMKEFDKGLFNYIAASYGYKKKESEEEDAKEVLVLPSSLDAKLSSSDLFSGDKPAAEKLSEQYHPSKVGTNCWEGKPIKNRYDASGQQTTDLSNVSCFVDADNIIYAIEVFEEEPNGICSKDLYNGAAGTKNKLKESCAVLYFDINGIKAPNSFGNDIFAFIITNSAKNSLYPVGGKLMGTINSGILNGVTSWAAGGGSCIPSNKDGRACAGRVVDEGLKIKYLKK